MLKYPKVGIGFCVVDEYSRVLLQKRKGKHAPGVYAFPGGHLEWGESFEACALRELNEEAGSDIVVTPPVFWTAANTFYPDEDAHYAVIFMQSTLLSGEAKLMEPEKGEMWEWHFWTHLPKPLMQGIQILKDRNVHL
jgi:8-oxo-dGTP diphosphatase